jgi:hypothetical protein
MKDFSQSILAASVFSSNLLFWRESDYFDTAAALKPLLHTWSLAVEEQFYVLFPLFLVFFWKLGKSWIIVTLALVFVSSLIGAQWSAYAKPAAAFYLLPMRIWEFLIGTFSALYLSQSNRKASWKVLNELGGWVGVGLIFYAVFAYDKATPYPGFYTLLPTLGTALIILFATQKNTVGRFLGNNALVGIGLLSYSAYLWHQPLFAFARHRSLSEPSQAHFAFLSLLSLALAYLSWKFVENPFRNKGTHNKGRILFLSAIFTLLFIFLGTAGSIKPGIIDSLRFNDQELSILRAKENISNRYSILGDDKKDPDWILLGDSHANALQEAVHSILSGSEKSSLVGTIDGCPPALNLVRFDVPFQNRCHEHYNQVLKIIKAEDIKNVLISSRFALYINSSRFDNKEGGIEFGQTKQVIYDLDVYKDMPIRKPSQRAEKISDEIFNFVREIAISGVRVFIIDSIPEVGWDVPKAAFRLLGTKAELKTLRKNYDERVFPLENLINRLKSLPNVFILRSSEVFCDSEFCYATKNLIPLYTDSNHLSVDGASLLIKHFAQDLLK